jgi:tetratricopeptide (TPR) repeat protein
LDPTYVKAYSRRGAARVALGKLQTAKEDFEQVLKLEPKNKQAEKELEKINKVWSYGTDLTVVVLCMSI